MVYILEKINTLKPTLNNYKFDQKLYLNKKDSNIKIDL